LIADDVAVFQLKLIPPELCYPGKIGLRCFGSGEAEKPEP